MTYPLIFAAVSTIAFATPELAQHADHGPAAPQASAPTVSDPSCPPEHAAMGHCTPKGSASTTQPATSPPTIAADPHAGHHGAPTQPALQDPNCPPEHASMGHCTPAAVKPTPGTSAPPVAPPSAAARSGPEHAADAIWGGETMAKSRRDVYAEHGSFRGGRILIDRFEYRAQGGHDGYAWDSEGWYGGDYDKLWLKTEGEGGFGEAVESAEMQALYSRAINPWFNLQAGIRYDIRPKPDRAHLAVGVQGLAPYWFEIDGALFLSDQGDLTARFEGEYDQRLTNQLILQPRVELDLAAQDVPELGIGAGLSSVEAGLRLRYEFVPEFAPYVGVEYGRRFGGSADFARAAGEKVGGWAFLVGVRAWF